MSIAGQTPRIFQGRYKSALTYLGALSTAGIAALGTQPEGTLVYNTTLSQFEVYNASGIPAGVPTFARTITVALFGGDVITITEGLAKAAALVPPPSATDPATVLVYPGVYTETITLLSFVSLIGVGGPSSVNIAAPATTDTIVTGAVAASMEGLTVSGASGAGGTGISHTAAGLPLTILNCAVLDCETGYTFSGAGVSVDGSLMAAQRFPGQTLVTALEVLSGAVFKGSDLNIEGTGASRITTALSVDGAGSILTASTVSISFADEGVLADDGGVANISTVEIQSAVTGIHASSTGSPRIQGAGVTIASSSSLDVLQDTLAGSILLTASNFLSSLTSIPAGSASILAHVSLDTDNEAFQVFGEFHVGAFTEGWGSFLGEGASYTTTMNVFRNTSGEAGAYTDVTASASSPSGSTFSAFPGVGTANTMFVGSSTPFSGIFSNTIVAMVLGAGTVVWEFWNGAAWTAFNVMAADAQAPLAQYANTPLERINTENVRFGPMTGWVTKTLTSDPFGAGAKFWVRAIVTTAAITTSPTIEQIKLQPNSTQINVDGSLEFFGDARVERPLILHRLLLVRLSGGLIDDEDLLYSTNVGMLAENNKFEDGSLNSSGSQSAIPPGLDTSSPLTLVLSWAGDATTGAAAVEWEVNFTQTKEGTVLDGTASDTLSTNIASLASFTANATILQSMS